MGFAVTGDIPHRKFPQFANYSYGFIMIAAIEECIRTRGPERLTAKEATRPQGEDLPATDTPGQPERFDRTRSARSVEILEDYTELIAELIRENGEARITDIAGRLGVTHPTATKAVARLKREGLVVSKPYRSVFLTEQGEEMAQRVHARHRLVVEFLLALGVPRDAAEADAEGIEHYVSDTTLSAFEAFLRTKP